MQSVKWMVWAGSSSEWARVGDYSSAMPWMVVVAGYVRHDAIVWQFCWIVRRRFIECRQIRWTVSVASGLESVGHATRTAPARSTSPTAGSVDCYVFVAEQLHGLGTFNCCLWDFYISNNCNCFMKIGGDWGMQCPRVPSYHWGYQKIEKLDNMFSNCSFDITSACVNRRTDRRHWRTLSDINVAR